MESTLGFDEQYAIILQKEEDKRNEIIKKNVETIHRKIIIQDIRNINLKFNRKLTSLEREELCKKIEKKIDRKLKKDDYILINDRLLKDA
jgi:hypothetical protein